MEKTVKIRRMYAPPAISVGHNVLEGSLTRVLRKYEDFDREKHYVVVFPSFYASTEDKTLDNLCLNDHLANVRLMYSYNSQIEWLDIRSTTMFNEDEDYIIEDDGTFYFYGETSVGETLYLKITAEWLDTRTNVIYPLESEVFEIITLEETEDERRLFVAGGSNNIIYNPFINGLYEQRVTIGLHVGTQEASLKEELDKRHISLEIDENFGGALMMDVQEYDVTFDPINIPAYYIGVQTVGFNTNVGRDSDNNIVALQDTEMIVKNVAFGSFAEITVGGAKRRMYANTDGECTFLIKKGEILQSLWVGGMNHRGNTNVIRSVEFDVEGRLVLGLNCCTSNVDFSFNINISDYETEATLDKMRVSIKRVEPSFDVVYENNAYLETGVRKIPYSVFVDGEKVIDPTTYFNVACKCVLRTSTGSTETTIRATNDSYMEVAISDNVIELEMTNNTTYKRSFKLIG